VVTLVSGLCVRVCVFAVRLAISWFYFVVVCRPPLSAPSALPASILVVAAATARWFDKKGCEGEYNE